MMYSANLHFNGLWFRTQCPAGQLAYSLCQARKSSSFQEHAGVAPRFPFFFTAFGLEDTRWKVFLDTSDVSCPYGYYPSFYNATALRAGKPSLARCLQRVSAVKMTWQVRDYQY